MITAKSPFTPSLAKIVLTADEAVSNWRVCIRCLMTCKEGREGETKRGTIGTRKRGGEEVRAREMESSTDVTTGSRSRTCNAIAQLLVVQQLCKSNQLSHSMSNKRRASYVQCTQNHSCNGCARCARHK